VNTSPEHERRLFICRCSGIVIVVAGVLGLLAACSTILFGGLLGATRVLEEGAIVVYRGWGGIALSLLTVVLAFAAFYRPSRVLYLCVTLAAAAGALAGGYLVALFLAPAALAGLVATFCSAAANAPPAVDAG
jgi:hypothetical protein